MKKTIILSCAILAISGLSVNAQVQGGGFNDANAPAAAINTVAEVQNMKDDSYITLKGNIENKVKHEKYMFKDATGSILVEIDDDDWKGQDVQPKDLVIIKGEVDKGWSKIEIDADQVTKVSK